MRGVISPAIAKDLPYGWAKQELEVLEDILSQRSRMTPVLEWEEAGSLMQHPLQLQRESRGQGPE